MNLFLGLMMIPVFMLGISAGMMMKTSHDTNDKCYWSGYAAGLEDNIDAKVSYRNGYKDCMEAKAK